MVIFHSYVSLPEGIHQFRGILKVETHSPSAQSDFGFSMKKWWDATGGFELLRVTQLSTQKKKARWKMDTSEKCCIYNVDGCNIRISTSFGRQLKQSIFFRPWNSCDHKWSHFFYVSLLRPRKSPSKWPGWGRFFGSQIILEQGNPWQS